MRVLFILLFIFSALVGNAQGDSDDKFDFNHYSIGVSPSALANYYKAFQVSQDYGITKNTNLTVELGYIYESFYKRPVEGYRVKAGGEFKQFSNSFVRGYLGVYGLYRNSTSDRQFTATFWEEGYSRKYSIQRDKTIIGVYMEQGFHFKVTDRFTLGVAGGLGYGVFTVVDNAEIPLDDVIDQFFNAFNPYDRPGQNSFIVASFNINFSYVIMQ